jgi:hypothetical protein
MRSINEIAARVLRPAIAVTLCVFVAAGLADKITALARAKPHVGDILAFVPARPMAGGDRTRLLVHRPDQFGCVLDLGVLRRSGGSLIVETETGGDTGDFRVHWAGSRTSSDTANCGNNADLLIDRRDFDILAVTASGYGIDRGRLPQATNLIP